MTTFMLVPGAWYGSWCWKRVRSSLQAMGHSVFTPSFTGVCERSHLLTRDIDLETHILDVMNLIRWEELADIVLCGHSYGGCVISGVADRMPERIRSLVFLDAFVPEDGESNLDLIPDELRNRLLEGTRNVGDGWRVPPIPAEVFNVNGTDREWVDRQCTVQPIESMRQPIELGNGIERLQNVSFIYATGWPENTPFNGSYARAKAKGWETTTLGCGHDAMLDEPEALTRLLLGASATTPRTSETRPRG